MTPSRSALLVILALGVLGCPPKEESEAEESAGDEAIMFPDEAAAQSTPRHEASEFVARGEAALARGELEEATAIFREAVAAEPTDPRAQLDLGLALELANDYEGAEAAYRQAITIDPDFAEALNNLGLLLRDRERASEAVPLLRRAVSIEAAMADGWMNLALALEESGDDRGAEEAYRQTVQLTPDDPMVRANLGLLLLRNGEESAAALELRRGLQHARGHPAALQAIGNGLRRAGHPDGAARAMEMLVDTMDDPTPAVLAELALAQRAGGDRAGAERTLERALRDDPDYATAHYLLGSMQAARGAYDEAIGHFERYLALEPSGPHADRVREHLAAAQSAR